MALIMTVATGPLLSWIRPTAAAGPQREQLPAVVPPAAAGEP
jgi:hypothetical protein